MTAHTGTSIDLDPAMLRWDGDISSLDIAPSLKIDATQLRSALLAMLIDSNNLEAAGVSASPPVSVGDLSVLVAVDRTFVVRAQFIFATTSDADGGAVFPRLLLRDGMDDLASTGAIELDRVGVDRSHDWAFLSLSDRALFVTEDVGSSNLALPERAA